ncbi:MAG TPA: hypothetical protein ENF85_03805, partial [Candidatus Bathyarchaeota archaeon]|nr:hypothetical protein [Candidatus Bathyarchaeota archaeon]
GRVFGALNGVLNIVKGLTTGYNRDLQEVKHHLWAGIDAVKDSLEILAGAIESMDVNEKRMRVMVEEGYTLALDLAERLTVELGLSFREAHMVVGNLVREMASSGKRISCLKPEDVERVAEKVLGKRVAVDENLVKEAVNPEESLLNRRSIGSPNPAEIERMLKERSTVLKAFREAWLLKKKSLEKARNSLRETVKKYLSGGYV